MIILINNKKYIITLLLINTIKLLFNNKFELVKFETETRNSKMKLEICEFSSFEFFEILACEVHGCTSISVLTKMTAHERPHKNYRFYWNNLFLANNFRE